VEVLWGGSTEDTIAIRIDVKGRDCVELKDLLNELFTIGLLNLQDGKGKVWVLSGKLHKKGHAPLTGSTIVSTDIQHHMLLVLYHVIVMLGIG